MNKTDIKFDDEVREKVVKGIDVLYRAVSSTLGPRSRAVGIDQDLGNGVSIWKIHKDGVNVAKSIHLPDPFEDFGVKVVREAAQKTVDQVGDSTTATVILAHALIHECLKVINNGENPMALRKKLEADVELLIAQLKKMAIPVKTLEQKISIATISASGDEALGKLIGETLEKIGDQGVMTVEESKNAETEVEIQEGMQLDRGYPHQLFMTDPEKLTAVYDDIPVLITDKPMLNLAEVGPMLQNLIFPAGPNTAPAISKLVIFSSEIGGEVLPMMLEHKMKGMFAFLPIKGPSHGNNQRDILHDLCALTGATFISEQAGMEFKDVKAEDLGKIGRIVSGKFTTTITNGGGTKEAVRDRIKIITAQMMDDTLSDFDHEQLRGRLAKLTNGVAVLKVGGATQVEMQERKERALDAVSATQAAIKEGIVPGGEISYLQLWSKMGEGTTGDQTKRILENVLKAPFKKLLSNAGYDPAEKLSELRNSTAEWGSGIDVTDGEIKNMVKAGIIDPVLAPISALKNALSVAIQIITLGAVIVPAQEKNK